MKKMILLCACLLALSVAGTSQKYGHLNMGGLVSLMPETKMADTVLAEYQKQLVAKGEDMAKNFQDKYTKFVAAAKAGELTALQQQSQQEDLQKDQNALMQYQQEINDKMTGKRDELLKPILEKAEKAVTEVAKTNGYLMIFDTSIFNSVLFAQDADDVMSLVMAKLGIPEPKK